MKPIVYIAAPYTLPDPVVNTRKAMALWSVLLNSGVVTPLCPHWSLLQHMHEPLGYEQWLAYDLELLARCDALYRAPGDSMGADREHSFAESQLIPCFSRTGDLFAWAKTWRHAR